MKDLTSLSWPASGLSEAARSLAQRSGLSPRMVERKVLRDEATSSDEEALSECMEATARGLGLEAEPVRVSYTDVERLVSGAGPALLRLPGEGEARLLAVLKGNRRSVSILAPDLRVKRVRTETICEALRSEAEAPVKVEVDRMLEEAGIGGRHRTRARAAITRERLGSRNLSGAWLIGARPGASPREQARQAKLHFMLAGLVGAYAFQLCLIIVSWWVLGEGVLGGRLDRGWLIAWALLLLTAVPARLLVTWWQGRFTIGAGRLLKQRLLYGALRLEPEEIRHQGAGQILSRILESTNIESLALNGGFLGLIACIELILAGVVLVAGAGGGFHALLLAVWIAIALLTGWSLFRRRHHWTETRLELTNDLIERMVGHRTRLAQERREQWHEGEDRAVEHYLEQSKAMDRMAMIQTCMARGWLVSGLLGLAPAFISGSAHAGALAASLGGVLLAFMALEKLGAGLSSLLGAAIAWRQVAPLFEAAARVESDEPHQLTIRKGKSVDGETLIEARGLVFRYEGRAQSVLRGIDLRINAGDRILLQGSSGGGKSTLASLLAGLRIPESGLLLLNGLDRQTLGGEGWRRRAVMVPQFHENHVLSATFAANLLMGRRWPPREEDLREAESLCRELGLGELLDRMPGGMHQMVGETGWQLSHGERSRLFMARALLQDESMVVLDESFAALDPKTMEQCLRFVKHRAATLLVIAHP